MEGWKASTASPTFHEVLSKFSFQFMFRIRIFHDSIPTAWVGRKSSAWPTRMSYIPSSGRDEPGLGRGGKYGRVRVGELEGARE